MSWEADVEQFIQNAGARTKKAFAGVAGAMHESIVDGSHITGAPGQPVDTGNLRTSFQLRFPAPMVAESLTNVGYAEDIEELDTPLKSKVGGHHSVKLTRVNFLRLVRHVVEKL